MTTITPINGTPVGVVQQQDFVMQAMFGIPAPIAYGNIRYVAPWKSAEENAQTDPETGEEGAPIPTVIVAQDCEEHGDIHYFIVADIDAELENPDTHEPVRIYGFVRSLDPEEEAKIPNGVDSAQ